MHKWLRTAGRLKNFPHQLSTPATDVVGGWKHSRTSLRAPSLECSKRYLNGSAIYYATLGNPADEVTSTEHEPSPTGSTIQSQSSLPKGLGRLLRDEGPSSTPPQDQSSRDGGRNESALEDGLSELPLHLPETKEWNLSLSAATILTDSPEDLTLDEIIPQLPCVKDLKSPRFGSNVLFLLTPSFSAWADRNHAFLPKAIDRIFSTKLSQGKTIRSLTAIVDALPGPARGSAQNEEPFISHHEGIAFLVSDTIVSSEPLKRTTPNRVRPESDREGPDPCVTFRWQKYMSRRSRENYAEMSYEQMRRFLKHAWVQECNVPLANTLFQNGREFTLYEDSWVFKRSESQGGTWERNASSPPQPRERSHCLVEVAQDMITFNAPLIKLTEPQKIVSCMGNVISRISDNHGNSVAASEELEKILPKLLEKRQLQGPQQVHVHALVSPKIVDRKEKALNLMFILDRGSGHFHRVTSGGGGWGNRAGLLSLDPAFGQPGNQPRAEVVIPGDSIQFFLTAEVVRKPGKNSIHVDPATRHNKIMVGTCSARDDSSYRHVPLSEYVRQQRDRKDGNFFVCNHYFGMMSEKPMTMYFPAGFGRKTPFSSTLSLPQGFLSARVPIPQGSHTDSDVENVKKRGSSSRGYFRLKL
ncbi:MAG: hypothetical protein Q9227_006704 [Pyrenula ochraceoflavens]